MQNGFITGHLWVRPLTFIIELFVEAIESGFTTNSPGKDYSWVSYVLRANAAFSASGAGPDAHEGSYTLHCNFMIKIWAL